MENLAVEIREIIKQRSEQNLEPGFYVLDIINGKHSRGSCLHKVDKDYLKWARKDLPLFLESKMISYENTCEELIATLPIVIRKNQVTVGF